jgi:uncharacterized membrane protein
MFSKKFISFLLVSLAFFCSSISYAASAGAELLNLQMITSAPAIFALVTFIISYFFVMTEEFTHLRKSKPVVIAAGVIWMAVAITATSNGVDYDKLNFTFRHVFLEFAELFMFLLVAMTFINTMTERNVF